MEVENGLVHEFYWQNLSSIIRTTLFYNCCDRLFYEVGLGGPNKSITQATILKFMEEHIIHRFGLPESIKVD